MRMTGRLFSDLNEVFYGRPRMVGHADDREAMFRLKPSFYDRTGGIKQPQPITANNKPQQNG